MILSDASVNMQKPLPKKQQSISSFFSTKPSDSNPDSEQRVPGLSNPESLPYTPRKGTNDLFVDDDEAISENADPASGGAKRTAEEDEEDSDDDDLPVVKRRRQTSAKSTEQSTSQVSPHASDIKVGAGNKSKITARTSKYAFTNSRVDAQVEQEPEDEEYRLMKERLHQKFVKKLGRPDSFAEMRRKNGAANADTAEDEEVADGEEEDDLEPAAPSKTKDKKAPAARRGKDNLTPLQKQIIDLKKKHPDALLVVEAGYKYHLYGEDARIASKELGMFCIPGKYRFDEHPSEAHLSRFASMSFPTHRLHVHVKRLLSVGHKVGIVRQLETAALKAVGNNRNKIFERGLTNLYTKGTYIDDQDALDNSWEDAKGGAAASSGHLLCLTESYPKGVGSDEKVHIGLIAVHPGTGDIIYDDFEDGWMRSELETRLLHISPCEFLIVGEVSKATEKIVQHLSGGQEARLERVPKPKTMAAQAYSHITKFYADKMKSNGPQSSQVESSQETGTLLDKVHKLSESATVCLSAMITHLTDYGLQHVFDLTRYFQSFSARSHMLLNGNTLTSLEIYRNQTDQREHGSLFWTMDRTQTRFGRRLLRRWVGRPLLDRNRLEERITAVEELKDSGVAVERIRDLLGKIKNDLERTLIRIYYHKCTRPELLGLLQTLQMIAQEYATVSSASEAGFKSDMLNQAIASLPDIGEDVIKYLDRINAQAAKSDDKYNFFRDEHETEDIADHKLGIAAVEHDLDEFKTVAAEKLKRKKVEYVTVADCEYLIELDNNQLKNVPASWIKISGTKAKSRYHAPEVVKLIRERDQHKEALSAACDTAFKALLTEISAKYQIFRDCVQSLAQLDCLLSLAAVATQPGYCKPTFTDEPGISITGGRHPMVEQLLLNPFVPNDLALSPASGGTRALLVTGPNMGGKSSYVRSVALIAIMAQIGSYVPAAAAELGLLDAVFTRMGAFDNMLRGESTFMVELSETSDILKQATPRSLVILDELGRGTSTHDGVAIAQAVLAHAVDTLCCLTLFITHYQTLARMRDHFAAGALSNVHMRFNEQRDPLTGETDVTFLYEVGEGSAHRSYGLNVAKLAGLPKTVIDEAARRSKQMEEEESRRRVSALAKAVAALVDGGGKDEVDHLVVGIEQF